MAKPIDVSFLLFFPVSTHAIPVPEQVVNELGMIEGPSALVAPLNTLVANRRTRDFVLFGVQLWFAIHCIVHRI